MNIPLNNLSATNLKVRRQKFGVNALLFLILFGGLFTTAGIFAFRGTQIDESWTKIQGEIVDVSSGIRDGSTMYTPVIRYTVNNTDYRIASSSSSSLYPNIGEKREVAYNPARPDQSKVIEDTGSTLLILLFPAIGILMVVLAPFLFIRSLNRSNRIKNLIQSGQKIQGVLVDIQSTGKSNNHSTYKIVVAATDNTGTVQNYVSDNLGGIAGLAMADFRNSPIPIDVYIDPLNPQNYYVDISDIPNLTPQRIGELIQSATSSSHPNTFVQEQPPSPTQQPKPPANPPLPPQNPHPGL